MIHVIGVDLSLTGTGVACRHGVETITTRGARDDDLTSRHERLLRIREHVLSWCRGADLVVIEQPAYSRVAGHQHDRSGLWWLTVHALYALEIPVAEVSPTTRARYATGRGNAPKDEVLAAVVRRFTEPAVSNNNEADALILAAMGHDVLGDPLTSMPLNHRVALDAVVWPQGAAA